MSFSENNEAKKIVGVSIVMSQREPYMSEEFETDRTWSYNVFGHFDEMRLEIINDPKGFSLKALQDNLANRNFEKRMQFHPETQKIFLWFEDSENFHIDSDNNAYTKEELFRRFAICKDAKGADMPSEGDNQRPFIGLLAIKLRHQFIDESRKCSLIKCLEDFLADSSDGCHIFAMNSLSIDDIYVLMIGSNPQIFLKSVDRLHNFVCPFDGCAGNDRGAERIAEMIEHQMSELDRFSSELYGNRYKVLDPKKWDAKIEECKTLLSEARVKQRLLDPAKVLEITESISNDAEISSDDAKKTSEYWYFRARCLGAVRTCSPMPGVLMTHSLIGYRHDALKVSSYKCYEDFAEIYSSIYPNESLNVELEVRLRPGADMGMFRNAFEEVLLECGAEIEAEAVSGKPKKKLQFINGIYDYTYNGDLTLSQLHWIYEHPIIKWRPYKGSSERMVEYSTTRFFIAQQEDCSSNAKIIVIKDQMRKEETQMAQRWVEEQQKVASRLFSLKGENEAESKQQADRLERIKKSFPYLYNELQELSALHAQGCRRLFYALTWNEFKGVRTYFEKFFVKLGSELDYLDDRDINNDDKNHCAYMLFNAAQRFRESMSLVFEERIILDLSMRKNTRPGAYATGAYEAIIQQYRKWIVSLRELLCEAENEINVNGNLETRVVDFPFTLRTLADGRIHSDDLFPLSQGVDRSKSIIIYTPLEVMLQPKYALPLFVHEIGHYVGITFKSHAAKACISMASFIFVTRITRDLCFSHYSQIPSHIFSKHTENLHREVSKYLCSRVLKKRNYDLDYIVNECEKELNVFLEGFPANSNQPEMEGMVLAIMQLHDAHNSLVHVTTSGRLSMKSSFNEIGLGSEGRLMHEMKVAISESYADLLMVQVLSLSLEEYFDVFINALERSDRMSDQATEGGRKYSFDLYATRTISVLMYFELKKRLDELSVSLIANKELLDDILAGLPDELNKWAQNIETGYPDSELVKKLSKAMISLAADGQANYKDLLRAWRIVAPYLLMTSRKMHKFLSAKRNNGDTDLNKITKHYQDICTHDDNEMRQLYNLLRP